MYDALLEGVGLALRLDTMIYMSVGLFLGMFVGALPGFTTLMAMAILLPISFFLDPLLGIPFLIGVYKGGIYGGSIPAILVSMPGTGAAVASAPSPADSNPKILANSSSTGPLRMSLRLT